MRLLSHTPGQLGQTLEIVHAEASAGARSTCR
jgi:hypothetical protein